MFYEDAVVSSHLPLDATYHEFPPIQETLQNAASAAREFLAQASLDVEYPISQASLGGQELECPVVKYKRFCGGSRQRAKRRALRNAMAIVPAQELESPVVENKPKGEAKRLRAKRRALRKAVELKLVPELAESNSIEEEEDQESRYAYLMAAANLISQSLGQPALDQQDTFAAPTSLEEPAPSLASLPLDVGRPALTGWPSARSL